MTSPSRGFKPAIASLGSATLLLSLMMMVPAQADDPDGGTATSPPVQMENLATAEEVLEEVSDDARPIEPEVTLVEFGEDATSEPADQDSAEEPESDAGTMRLGDDEGSEAQQGEVEEADPAEDEDAATSGDGDVSSGDGEEELSLEGADAADGAEPAEDEGDAEGAEPSDGESTEPSDGESTEPSDGESTEPTDGESTEPSDGESSEPSDDERSERPDDPDSESSPEEPEEPQPNVATLDVPELAVIGVTWEVGSTPEDLEVEFRTRSDDVWSEWDELHIENDFAEDGQSQTDGTEPHAILDVESVEVRLLTEGELPPEARVSVIDPGEASADSADVTSASSMSTMSTTRPTIHTRAQWGADESIRFWSPQMGRVTGLDIHHTAGVNGYTQAQVPAIIRGIYAFHTLESGRGWGDIGYNVLVDRFGRAWEGRYGGVDQAIIGAHATGINDHMAGLSLMGNHETQAVSAAAFDMLARVGAWKLAIHGVTPHGTTTFNGNTYNRIIGHRDVAQTTCPGRYMYSRLGELRNRIASLQGSFANRTLNRDLDGDGRPDLIVREGTQVSLASPNTSAWQRDRVGGTGWREGRFTAAGDWNRDGHDDMIYRDNAGQLWVYLGNAAGTFSASRRVQIGTSGWQHLTYLVGGHDWDGDGHPDLIGRRSNGELWLYTSNANGKIGSRTRIGTGWNGMASLTIAEDWINGQPALLAAHRSRGDLYAYPINASGRLSPRITVGTSGWASMSMLTAVGDVTGDGVSDFVTVDGAGRLWLYQGRGDGKRGTRELLGAGYGSHRHMTSAGNGGDAQFLYIATSETQLWRERPTASPNLERRPTGLTLRANDVSVLTPGDWDGDGRPDLMVIRADGRLFLHRGLGNGRFDNTGRSLASNFTVFEQVVGAGNWRGDGRPGLLAYDRRTGAVWLYPGDGSGGFNMPRIRLTTAAAGMDRIVNAGLWNGGGAPDILMRGASTRNMFHYDGNGAALLFSRVQIATNWSSYDSILGVNDVSGDGRADLVTVSQNGAVTLHLGNGSGGFIDRIAVGRLPAAAEVS